MLLQSMAICWEMFFVAIVYGLNEIYPNMPEFITKMEHIAWLCVHGDTPIIYVLLNASLRQKFFSLIKNYTKKTGNTMIHLATSVYPTQIHPHNRIYFLTDQTQNQSTNPNAPIPSTIPTQPTSQ
uniref:Uncharacterized protein n=1 Tax=Acrobeloides nanus TaxID=290746 RepID=A0A914CLJ9_9BILA